MSAKPKKKRRMASFVFTFILLILTAGAVFWFGWVQFELEEGDYAVIFTKISGYETEPLHSGEFAWRAQALLPTNLTLHTFRVTSREARMLKGGELPSGSLYSSFLGADIDFGWSIDVLVTYKLKPESLPQMVADGFVSEGLDSFYTEFEAGLNSELTRIAAEEADADPSGSAAERLNRIQRTLDTRLTGLDERVSILNVTIRDWQFPDMVLYSEARKLVLDLLSKRQIALAEVENNAVRRDDIQNDRLQLLEEYGRILNEYPVLLDFFALEDSPGTSLLPQVVPEN